jgi:DNA polymerase elongation subunit (family B)|tara:strand:+ start:448 stop:1458 length:1011 start_codon:yes stop_codon:yes gene_type:complete
MKHLEITPWFICDENDENLCAYVDTDSNYFNAEPLLLHLYPDFEQKTDEEKDKILEKVALYYQDFISSHYDNLARDCFNVTNHRLEMKTECVIRSAYFRAPRRYAQWITMQEGIILKNKKKKRKEDVGQVVGTDNGGGTQYEMEIGSLDVKGLEYKKSNFPKVFGNFFKNVLEDVLKGTQQPEIDKRILDFKKEILTNIPIGELGNPTGVKTLNKYIERKPVGGEAFTIIRKGAPAAVRATIKYNDLLRYWKLDNQYETIVQGSKVKWIYLKKNPYNIDALAYLDYNIPPKIKEFLDKFADKEKVFDTILLNKLEGFYNDLEWKLVTNPYVNQFFI